MGTLRTVFAFIVLVCAIAFASAAYVLTNEATNWKKKFEDMQTAKDAEILKLNADIKTLNDNVAKAIELRETAQKESRDKEAVIGVKDTEIARLGLLIKDLEASKKRLEDDIAQIKTDLGTQTKNNEDLSKKAEDARLAKEAALAAQKVAEDKLAAAEDDIANLRNQLKLTKNELRSSKDLNGRYAEVYGENGLRLAQAAPAPVPVINGEVLSADNPMRLVQISVGVDDGVVPGMTFEVVRPEAKEYVGRIRVIEVKDTLSVCRVDTAMTTTPIREGDRVTTRVK